MESIIKKQIDISKRRRYNFNDLPIPAKKKILKLSNSIMAKLAQDESYAAKIALNTQIMFEQKGFVSAEVTCQSELYQMTEKIIIQGQREGSVAEGLPMKLADYYWGVVCLYAIKSYLQQSMK